MAKIKRKIIKIDEDKCNGCGACIPGCKEGALQIVDGKAKLVSDVYCDGLGACLGDCPQGALTIVEREADEFDEAAVSEHLKPPLPCGCPGTMTKTLKRCPARNVSIGDQQSELTQWPIQLALIPVNAPYLKEAQLVLLADCTAVAYANLHRDFVKDRVIAMACSKLDEVQPYIEKLAGMIKHNDLKSIEVVMMEVPCCSGLGAIADEASKLSGCNVVIKKTIISLAQ